MSDSTDQQLLRDYVECGSETAFAELVRRHVDFVYSAALRMVCNTHLAEDVAQAVFVALAKNARQLLGCLALEGWLHNTSRNLAANAVRAEVRRRDREQEAAFMNEMLTKDADLKWEHIAPYLDEALSELNEPERDALMLRYFKNQDFRAVGAMLGISDDTAQKRVSRAVEKLREYFSNRKISIGVGGLVALISANAVQSAPIGLAVTISAAALAGTAAASTSTVIATATKTIAMTTLQKTLVIATVAVLAGAGIYKAQQAANLRDQVQSLQQQQAPLAEQLQQLQQERDEAIKRLALLSAKPVPRLPAPPVHIVAGTNTPMEDLEPTNLYARFKDKWPKLTTEQVEAYLKANGRSASSLLAAYRTSGDPVLLQEAMLKYPSNPQGAHLDTVLNFRSKGHSNGGCDEPHPKRRDGASLWRSKTVRDV